LHELLEQYAMPACLDMVDIDIQGAEYPRYFAGVGLFGHDPASDGRKDGLYAIDVLTRMAKRVHIGLHQNAESDAELIKLFEERGWRVQYYFERDMNRNSQNNTQLGPVAFGDGVLSMVNDNPLPACKPPP
jgi:hypothetical protein